MTSMSTYAEFEAAAPTIATPIRQRLEEAGLTFLATIRRDGSPRISPVEVEFIDGHLYFGSMPGAQKAHDIARDARCSLITPIVDKKDMRGEGKLFAQARLVTDLAESERVLRTSAEGNEMDPEALLGSPVYEIVVHAASWQYVENDAWTTRSWKEGDQIRTRVRKDATGLPEYVD
jgi:hypothetical protein